MIIIGNINYAFADSLTTQAELKQQNSTFSENDLFDEPVSVIDSTYEHLSVQATQEYVAVLRMFSVGANNTRGSSGDDGSSAFGTHSFITVKNISGSNLTIGGLSGITDGKTVSLGTWGNKSEHKGLWYNLESEMIASFNTYGGRVSTHMWLTKEQLNNLNYFITNRDSWSYTNNCSSFAVRAWNYVSDNKYSAGSPNTPRNLAFSIRDGAYSIDVAVPQDYKVYYANGTSAPVKSNVWN